jgi:hypothetical protein
LKKDINLLTFLLLFSGAATGKKEKKKKPCVRQSAHRHAKKKKIE